TCLSMDGPGSWQVSERKNLIASEGNPDHQMALACVCHSKDHSARHPQRLLRKIGVYLDFIKQGHHSRLKSAYLQWQALRRLLLRAIVIDIARFTVRQATP